MPPGGVVCTVTRVPILSKSDRTLLHVQLTSCYRRHVEWLFFGMNVPQMHEEEQPVPSLLDCSVVLMRSPTCGDRLFVRWPIRHSVGFQTPILIGFRRTLTTIYSGNAHHAVLPALLVHSCRSLYIDKRVNHHSLRKLCILAKLSLMGKRSLSLQLTSRTKPACRSYFPLAVPKS